MANISDVQGNIGIVKSTYKKFLSLGEGVSSEEFTMIIEDYPDLRFLVQTTQIPPMVRENIESYGPLGSQFNQQGRFKNAQEVPVSFKEVITGVAYKALRDWVKNKQYKKVTLALTGESFPTSTAANTVVMEDCWIELEGCDLSVEDGGTLVKPSGTIHANWISWLDDEDAQSISMDSSAS